MLRKILLPAFCLALLVSCSTTVGIHYTEPSDVDLSGCHSVAVAPVKAYDGLVIDTGWVYKVPEPVLADVAVFFTAEEIEEGVRDYAESLLMEILSSQDYYDVLPPGESAGCITGDDYSKLFQMGYDAVIVPEVTHMGLSDRIRSKTHTERDTDGEGNEISVVIREYYLYQTVELEYTIKVVSAESGEEIGRRSFKSSRTHNYLIDTIRPEYNDMSIYFRRMLRSFSDGIRKMLVPESRVLKAKLMKNKPEDIRAEEAFKAIEDGDSVTALSIFQAVWNESGHVPSGYNAALLLASSGDIPSALSLLDEVIAASGNEDAQDLSGDLKAIARPAVAEAEDGGAEE